MTPSQEEFKALKTQVERAVKTLQDLTNDLQGNLVTEQSAGSKEKPKKPKKNEQLPTGFDPVHYSGDPDDPDPMHRRPLPQAEAEAEPESEPEPELEQAAPSEEVSSVPTETVEAASSDEFRVGDPTWLGAWSGNVTDTVRSKVEEAERQDKTPVFISYNIPNRDNGNFSAGGVLNKEEFTAWAEGIAEGIGDSKAIVVLEPDALALSRELDKGPQDERIEMLQLAIDALSVCHNVTIFVDASTWVPPREMAELLNRLEGMTGFSCNVSGWEATDKVLPWADEVANYSGLVYIVDTSRNGRGNPHSPAWCNVTDTLVGERPTTKTDSENCLAYFWAKIPGESDGLKINGHDHDGQPVRIDVPSAGERWPDFEAAIYSGNWTEFKQKYGV